MESAGFQTVQVERRDGAGWVVLNRPESINAINNAMRHELPQALATLDADPAIRVIALRGAGPRGFCAGADLKESEAGPGANPPPLAPGQSTWIEALDRIRKPIVAILHGYCFGGGLEIALACDLRIAAEDAVFALPETGLGLIPGGGGTQRLPRVVGLGPALSLLMTGERIDAREAFRIGLVTRLLSGGDGHLSDASAYVTRLAERPPLALSAVKEATRESLSRPLAEGLRLERELFTRLLATEDRREAVAAFREKRPPVFKNR
jgi:enoyl-CoA hydratase/carnithine racemase